MINSGGVKVQVEQVEAALAQHGGAVLAGRRFFVAGLPDERLGQRVALVIEGEPLAAADEQALAQVVAQHVQPYAAPRQFVYCPQFAETPTGKIDRGGHWRACHRRFDRTSGYSVAEIPEVFHRLSDDFGAIAASDSQ